MTSASLAGPPTATQTRSARNATSPASHARTGAWSATDMSASSARPAMTFAWETSASTPARSARSNPAHAACLVTQLAFHVRARRTSARLAALQAPSTICSKISVWRILAHRAWVTWRACASTASSRALSALQGHKFAPRAPKWTVLRTCTDQHASQSALLDSRSTR